MSGIETKNKQIPPVSPIMDSIDLTSILLSTIEFPVSLVAAIRHTPCAVRFAPRAHHSYRSAFTGLAVAVLMDW